MNTFARFAPFFVIFGLLVSCKDTKQNPDSGSEPSATETTPKALQDDTYDISFSKRSGRDLVDELYQELLSSSQELKDLEAAWEKLDESKKAPFEKLEKYSEKSEDYLRSAKYKAERIMDSTLRKKILDLVESNEKYYQSKVKEFNSLKEKIAQNDAALRDHYLAMKIMLTLPLIEKYQSEDLPDNQKEFKEIIKEQERLIQRMDSLSNGK